MQSNSIYIDINVKFGLYTYWVTVQNRFSFWPCWPNFGPVVATKWLKMVVSNHFLKKYLRNPTKIWCLHLLGGCSELICFLATLAKFWPSSDTKCLKMVVSDHYLKKDSLKQSSSNSVSTRIGRLSTIHSLFGHIGQFLALYWPQYDWKWWPLSWPSLYFHSLWLGHRRGRASSDALFQLIYVYTISFQKGKKNVVKAEKYNQGQRLKRLGKMVSIFNN